MELKSVKSKVVKSKIALTNTKDGVREKGCWSLFCQLDIIHQFCRKLHAGSNGGTEKTSICFKIVCKLHV